MLVIGVGETGKLGQPRVMAVRAEGEGGPKEGISWMAGLGQAARGKAALDRIIKPGYVKYLFPSSSHTLGCNDFILESQS